MVLGLARGAVAAAEGHPCGLRDAFLALEAEEDPETAGHRLMAEAAGPDASRRARHPSEALLAEMGVTMGTMVTPAFTISIEMAAVWLSPARRPIASSSRSARTSRSSETG